LPEKLLIKRERAEFPFLTIGNNDATGKHHRKQQPGAFRKTKLKIEEV